MRPHPLQALGWGSGPCDQQGAAESQACGTSLQPVQTGKERRQPPFHHWVLRLGRGGPHQPVLPTSATHKLSYGHPQDASRGRTGRHLPLLSRALISCHSLLEPPALAGRKGPTALWSLRQVGPLLLPRQGPGTALSRGGQGPRHWRKVAWTSGQFTEEGNDQGKGWAQGGQWVVSSSNPEGQHGLGKALMSLRSSLQP